MQYALLIYSEPTAEPLSDEATAAYMKAYQQFTEEVIAAGVMQGGEALEEVSTATTVRVRDDDVITSDGPFAETKEVLGGFYLLDCADLDEVLGWAAKIPTAKHGSVEVRPVWSVPEEYSTES